LKNERKAFDREFEQKNTVLEKENRNPLKNCGKAQKEGRKTM